MSHKPLISQKNRLTQKEKIRMKIQRRKPKIHYLQKIIKLNCQNLNLLQVHQIMRNLKKKRKDKINRNKNKTVILILIKKVRKSLQKHPLLGKGLGINKPKIKIVCQHLQNLNKIHNYHLKVKIKRNQENSSWDQLIQVKTTRRGRKIPKNPNEIFILCIFCLNFCWVIIIFKS